MIKRFFIEALDFARQIYLNRHLISELTKRDFKNKYIKNLLGLSWAILEPLAMVVILWFVFTFLRGSRSGEYPFAIFMLTGLIAYDLFSNSLSFGTKSIQIYSFLLKQVNFRIAILPMVKIFSSVLMHLIILVIVLIILIASRIYPSLYWLQVFYYMIALVCLLVGVTWLTSSILLFFPDISNIISILVRILFFLTPIFYDISSFPETYAFIMKLNPLYYIVNGYRESFLYEIAFWSHPLLTIYYWGFTVVSILVGVVVFKRLRPHFADVI